MCILSLQDQGTELLFSFVGFFCADWSLTGTSCFGLPKPQIKVFNEKMRFLQIINFSLDHLITYAPSTH